MVHTRGKGFTKVKNKRKNSYRGGNINSNTVNSYIFSDSE